MTAMVQDWRQEWSPAKPGETLMLSATRAEVSQLNQQARAQLLAEGLLGPGATVQTGEGRSLEVREGDRVLCTRNSRQLGLQNGTLATVERVIPSRSGDSCRLTLRTDDGRRVQFDSAHYAHLAHGYAVTTHKAQGVTVDRTLILGGGDMASRELAYVQMSRHRESARLYVDQTEVDQAATIHDLAKELGREKQKETTLDFAPKLSELEKQLHEEQKMKEFEKQPERHEQKSGQEPELEPEAEME
jgi:ATP-dependent exoDNAse (exonuclease V) alpha subunit